MAVKAEQTDSPALDTLPPALQTPQPSPRKRTKRTQAQDDADTSPRKRQIAAANKVPTTMDEMSEEDRLLFRMRDKEGASWTEICAAWAELTGKPVKSDMVRKRFAKMKANFATFDEEDVPRLIDVRRRVNEEIEKAKEDIERQRFSRMATALVESGGGDYSVAVIQKKLKELDRE
ncbi:hypothetical protein KEM56_001233 [Ascosphaera pollenicola]|nr:hypothetical protein KEM56_001233 [Ascosphaera pollenicola]